MTNFRYPSLEMIESLFVGTSALEKVNIERFDDLEKTYSKGAFFLSSFTSDFDNDIGTDAHMEFFDDDKPGQLIALQIKSGTSWFMCFRYNRFQERRLVIL
ncbi:DUF4365 domain-containing protein [Streptococcus suis]